MARRTSNPNNWKKYKGMDRFNGGLKMRAVHTEMTNNRHLVKAPVETDYHKILINNLPKYRHKQKLAKDIPSPFNTIEKTYNQAMLIDSAGLSLSPSYTMSNLPDYHPNDKTDKCNFAFGHNREEIKQNLADMLNTPKIIISANVGHSKIDAHIKTLDGHILVKTFDDNILSFYAIAPTIDRLVLPELFRLDIIVSPDRRFFRITGSTIVGGLQEGDCPLLQINSPNKYSENEMCRSYISRSEYTGYHPRNTESSDSLYHSITELPDIQTFEQACDYMFKNFNIQSTCGAIHSSTKILDIIKSVQNNKLELSPIDSSMITEFIDMYEQGLLGDKYSNQPYLQNKSTTSNVENESNENNDGDDDIPSDGMLPRR